MKFRLLEWVRCPVCLSALRLEGSPIRVAARPPGSGLGQCRGQCPFTEISRNARDCAACAQYEVMAGALACLACGQRYAIEGGIPRLRPSAQRFAGEQKARTASSYGYIWNRSAAGTRADVVGPYHFEKMERALSLPRLSGLVLDAGCGDGIDLVNGSRRAGVEIVGVELSDGGCRATFERALASPAAHVVQGDICRLPFGDDGFDFVYSYGVLHHLPSPKEGLQELVRVLKPGGRVAAYLYEDFSDRAAGWRFLLRFVNQFRRATPRMSHRALYAVCRAASPVVYMLFTLPFHVLGRIPGARSLAAGFPFRHATGPFSLAGDLYDRFSAPIEWRYNLRGGKGLFLDAGLQDIAVANERGWMVCGTKPFSGPPCAG